MRMNKIFQNLPYKIGSSSMIFGHDVVENASLLSQIVDHMEIILFYTTNLNNIPSRKQIRCLNQIQQQHGISYSVHLPTFLEIGASCMNRRKDAVRMVSEICHLMAELNPVYYILHVPFSPPTLAAVPGLYFKSKDSEKWEDWTIRSVESLAFLQEMLPKSCKLLVENINYSPQFLKPFIETGFCGLCLDIGHLVLGDESVSDNLADNFPAIGEIHLHGVKGHEDHLCVSELPGPMLCRCFQYLNNRRYRGIVNLEVFSPADLNGSIAVLIETLETISR